MAPYKGDWRVKEYKPYTEGLEDKIAGLLAEVSVLKAQLREGRSHCRHSYPDFAQHHDIRPSALDEWGYRSTLLWP